MVPVVLGINNTLFGSVLALAALGGSLVVLGFIARIAVLYWHSRSPRLQITPFSWAAEEGERESLWVTSLFRDHLKELRLDGLAAVPDRAPGTPLMEIVEGVAQGVGQGVEWGKVMGRLWRAVVPDSAYEVWATLRPSGEGSGSISIQLIRRGRGNQTLVSFTSEAADWNICAREAAMAAAGALYPHLAKRHKGPWVKWNQPVPPDLLGLYQSALEHERNHQFEQALCEFRETVEKDPLNPQLRLKVAMVEERLDLHLGAWFTYWAIVAESDRRLWKGAHRRTRLVALYRLAIHLWNPRLAKEWVRTEKWDQDGFNSEELKLLRTELLRILRREDVFKGGKGASVGGSAASASASELMGLIAGGRTREALVEPFEDGNKSETRTAEIAEVLRIVSLERLEELKERMSRSRDRGGRRWPSRGCRRRPLRRWLARGELPPLAVEASEVLLRGLLAENVEARLLATGDRVPDDIGNAHGAHLNRWPFPGWADRHWASTLRRRATVWLEDRRNDAWQLHYNAACTIATQLSDDSIRRDRTEVKTAGWVRAAVKQLESFSYYAGSPRVAAMADWIAFEDPDLEDLYRQGEFKLWGSQRFGFGLPDERPPQGEVDRHTVLILKRSAAAFAASWRERAATGAVGPSSPLDWWTEELEIWERLEMICREHRSWHRRLKCFEALEQWNAANEPTVAFAREKREHRLAAEPLPSSCLEDLREQIGVEKHGNERSLSWVMSRVREVTTEYEELPQPSRDEPVALSQGERQAAIEAAKFWSEVEQTLARALRGSYQ
ncbi:MAG TPA: hypothetical protein VFI03_00185 [Solirubrobacterales bacterium]|nr:hypothetical protein [Solirubrobacterales bacterium]